MADQSIIILAMAEISSNLLLAISMFLYFEI